MTYSGQESAYDPSGNAQCEAERADCVALNHDVDYPVLKPREDWSDVYRIQAERDEAVGRGGLPAIGNHRTISAEWMRPPLNGDDQQRRSWWPARARCLTPNTHCTMRSM